MLFEGNWKLSFIVSDTVCQFAYQRNGQTVMEAQVSDHCIIVSMLFSYSNKPLRLKAQASTGNQIDFCYRSYRIEIYVNGILQDEEWPCGEHFLNSAQLCQKNTEINITKISVSEMSEYSWLPTIIGTFKGAEGWQPEENVFVGDCMPYCHQGIYHILYLKDRHHHQSKWGAGAHQWAHVSSNDLINWNIHPMAVEIDDPLEGSICTGSWILCGEKHVSYYSIRQMDGSSAPICRSVSQDGYHYYKDRTFHFTLSDRYNGSSARDPKAIMENGKYHMFVTTSEMKTGKGCLAHLCSTDGEIWTETDSIYVAPDSNQPECPDYFQLNEWYYLIFSHHGKGQYVYSRLPFSDWKVPEAREIPCKSVPKMAIWNGRIIFAGFQGINGYAGTLTFMEAIQKENGELKFIPVGETMSI